MDCFKITTLILGLGVIALSISTLTYRNSKLVECDVQTVNATFSFGFLGVTYSLKKIQPEKSTTQQISYTDRSMISSDQANTITSLTYPSFGLLITVATLVTVLLFLFFFEILYSSKIIGFLLILIIVFTVVATGLAMNLLSAGSDFINNLFNVTSSCALEIGNDLLLGVFVAMCLFVISAFVFMRNKGLFTYSGPSYSKV